MSLLYGILGFLEANSGGGGAGGLLDDYTSGLVGLYSTRQRLTAYSGPLVQVRRSLDNTTQDIGFDGAGALDSVALLLFVGVGDGYVSKWYDQSGGGNDASQVTSGAQPQIVSSGTYLGYLHFDATDDTMVCVNTHASTAGWSAFMRADQYSTSSRSIFFSTDSGGQGGSPSSSPIFLWDWDNSNSIYRSILAADSDADLLILKIGSVTLDGNVHAILLDLTTTDNSLRSRYYVSGGLQTPTLGTNGSFPDTATLNNVEPWIIGSRGGSGFAAINATDYAIYDATVSGDYVTNVSSLLAYTP